MQVCCRLTLTQSFLWGLRVSLDLLFCSSCCCVLVYIQVMSWGMEASFAVMGPFHHKYPSRGHVPAVQWLCIDAAVEF